MIIAIPTEDKDLSSGVCSSFGRTPYFVFYNTESKISIFMDNPAFSAQGGAGIKAGQFIASNNAEVLLTPRCGENASEVLMAANIRLFKTINDNAQNNINEYLEGKLTELNYIHPGLHKRGDLK